MSVRNRVWIILTAILAIACSLLVWQLITVRDALATANQNALSTLEQTRDINRDIFAARKQALTWRDEMLKVAVPTIREIESWPEGQQFPYILQERLLKLGFSDAASEILADLREHPELIPYPGIHGSNMIFGRCRMVGVDRVIAYFEDGHYCGWVLMAFEVEKSRRIVWRLVYATADGRDPVYGEGLQPIDTTMNFIP